MFTMLTSQSIPASKSNLIQSTHLNYVRFHCLIVSCIMFFVCKAKISKADHHHHYGQHITNFRTNGLAHAPFGGNFNFWRRKWDNLCSRKTLLCCQQVIIITISPSHHLTISPSHHPTISPSHRVPEKHRSLFLVRILSSHSLTSSFLCF